MKPRTWREDVTVLAARLYVLGTEADQKTRTMDLPEDIGFFQGRADAYRYAYDSLVVLLNRRED